jgi:hypothetical protein
MGAPTMAENAAAYAALKEAYDIGALLPPPVLRDPLYWDLPQIHDTVIKALEAENQTPQRIDRINDQIDEPARDTRRIQYQDASLDWISRESPLTLNVAYEIARFIVTPDEFGVIKQIGTHVGIYDRVTEKIIISDPFDPWALHRLGCDGFWFLRLYQNTFQPMPPFDNGVPIWQVAGYGFPELAHWRDNRFQWGKWNSEVFWLIPSNHALRLYFVPTQDDGDDHYFVELSGRLVGFTQPIDTVPAVKNVLYAW